MTHCETRKYLSETHLIPGPLQTRNGSCGPGPAHHGCRHHATQGPLDSWEPPGLCCPSENSSPPLQTIIQDGVSCAQLCAEHCAVENSQAQRRAGLQQTQGALCPE